MKETAMQCYICQKPLSEEKMRRHAKFCDKTCANKHWANLYRRANPRIHKGLSLPTGTIGAMHEMVVAVDLMSRGYHVFRALSQACPCDLAILKNGKLIRVECTTGTYNRNPNSWSHPLKDNKKYDVLAVVFHKEIKYIPAEF